MYRWEVKHVSGMGNRSPPRGSQVNAASQQVSKLFSAAMFDLHS